MNRQVNVDDETGFDDGRGGFDQGPKKHIPGAKAFVYLMLLIGLAIMGWIIYNNLPSNQPSAQDEDLGRKANQAVNSLPRYQFDTTPSNALREPEKPTVVEAPALSAAPTPAPGAPNMPPPAATANAEEALTPEEKALQRRLGGFSSSGSDSSGASIQPTAAKGDSGQGGGFLGGGTDNDSQALANRLKSANYGRAQASMLKNPSFTVPMGTLIPCGTTTELNSTQPGMVGCQVSRDIYSADGKVRLIDKGTQVTGEVASAMAQGQDRVFALWTRLRTPENVVINLDSPGTNDLGSAGIDGQVNRHFWQRFGGALMVSVMSDVAQAAIQAAANSSQNSNTTVNLGTTQATGNQLANEVLRATIDIPPTLYAEQGKAVAIYVAHDLDFSDVYSLSYGNREVNAH